MAGKDKNKGVKKSILGRFLSSNITTLASSNERSLMNEREQSKTKSVIERNSVEEYISNLMLTKDHKVFIPAKHKEFTIDRQLSRRITYPIVPIPKRPIIYNKSINKSQSHDYTSESSLTPSEESIKHITDIPTDSELADARDDSLPSLSDYNNSESENLGSDTDLTSSTCTFYQSSAPIIDKKLSSDTYSFDYIKDTNIKDIHMIKYCVELKNRIKNLKSNYDLSQLTAKQLDEIELEGFYEWRRILSQIEEMENLLMTPYEKNIEYWRQLWRVVERSHLICIIIDARDFIFYRTPDLEYYIKQVDMRKDILLILNKSDFLTKKQRFLWHNYLKKLDLNFVFFSALRELFSQSIIKLNNDEILDENNSYPAYGNLSYEDEDSEFNIKTVNQLLDLFACKKNELSSLYNDDEWIVESGIPQFVVGFIGYPNVGKSSIINSILGDKKVSVSEQPGKTKHFQTIQIGIPGITLCDCPGLIFPSIVSTKYHLLTNGIASIHQFRGKLIPAVQIICDLIPTQLCKKFNIPLAKVLSQRCKSESSDNNCRVNANLLLEKLCELRKFTSSGKGGQYDLNRASRLILSNYISGHLLYSHNPPDYNEYSECLICNELSNAKTIVSDDFDEWLNSGETANTHATMTKRKMRFLRKNMFKSNSKSIKNIEDY